MLKYMDSGNEDRLYNDETDLLQKDYESASARLLGLDIGYWNKKANQKDVVGLS